MFTADTRNKVWVGDITYLPTKHDFLYLAVFIDIFSRKITGWAMDTRIRDNLVLSALNRAIVRENPDLGIIVHTDRGSHEINGTNKSTSKNNVHYHYQPSWWEAAIMIACVSYIGAVLKGTIPLNGFTAFLGVVIIIVFLYFLNETMVPW